MAYGKIKADAIVYDNSGSDVEVSTSSIASKANLASPAFTGTPTAPTASGGTNTTQLATTAYAVTAAKGLVEQGSTYRVQILAIAGGGAGGYTDSGYSGGGGGAGGAIYHDGFMVTDGDAYTVVIGSGANGPTSDAQMGQCNNSQAPNGGDTTISGTGLYVECYGGGGGAGYNGNYLEGAAGGCGGGGEGYEYTYRSSSSHARQGGGGTSAFGTHGGMGAVNQGNFGDGDYAGGGGGGIGGASPHHRSQGGHGSAAFHEWMVATSSGVVNSSVYYLGGGGGGGEANSSGGGAGKGGAGDGGNSSGSSGADATDGTGSGGGGRGRWNTGSGRGGNGGDGLVIFRYPDSNGQKATGGTVTQSGGWYYHKFTSGATFTA